MNASYSTVQKVRNEKKKIYLFTIKKIMELIWGLGITLKAYNNTNPQLLNLKFHAFRIWSGFKAFKITHIDYKTFGINIYFGKQQSGVVL